MRPRTLDELVGQDDLLAPGSVLRGMIEDSRLRSILLFGPAGTGKTSVALLVAQRMGAAFVQLSAVSSGVADVRKAVDEGRRLSGATRRQTILFVDEVHRFNRTQQDALLPGVENGWVVFIGATTENPFFSVTSPLLSRCVLFRLEPLGRQALEAIVVRAVADPVRGLGGRVSIRPEAMEELVSRSEGDARVALNALEAAAARGRRTGAGTEAATAIGVEDVRDAMRHRFLRYGRDEHYDMASAFIKSMRGSNPDAALAWLARMLRAGEDPRFIARRMIIFASEDVGQADPRALGVAVAAAQAVEFVGLPEVRLNLAHAAVYLATAPKSNAVIRGIDAADAAVEGAGAGRVPSHLADASYPGAETLGRGVGYKYPHSEPGAEQEYMPEGFEKDRYWFPEPGVGRSHGGARRNGPGRPTSSEGDE